MLQRALITTKVNVGTMDESILCINDLVSKVALTL